MKIHPETLIDRGCWISDDRTYAFLSWETNTIGEIGFHGAQPVSRNSRVLAGGEGVCSFWIRHPGGKEEQLLFGEVEWMPGYARVRAEYSSGSVGIEITPAGRSLIITFFRTASPASTVIVLFHVSSLFSLVQGDRVWSSDPSTGSHAAFRFRDRIILGDWMKRKGRYAGDFLIPEPLRRRIFARRCRSGLATAEDLLPEYADSLMPIYDATVTVTLGGNGYTREERGKDLAFVLPAAKSRDAHPPFVVEFADAGAQAGGDADLLENAGRVQAEQTRIFGIAPRLHMPDAPHVADFVATIPALVESGVVRDYGIPRATPGRYYWIWAWDAIVTALASLRWGGTALAENTARFVNAHRDEGGLIPMRWTRSLEPLDTQPRGSLEALLTSLAYETYLDTQDRRILEEIYPATLSHLAKLSGECDARGFFKNIGFYPDLPQQFGRTEESAVAIEAGNFYTFCRTCENIGLVMGNDAMCMQASQMSRRLEENFLRDFWDDRAGFIIDAVDVTTGRKNTSYPLFTLMFLHSPLGWPLIRPKIGDCAEFIARNHLSQWGLRVLPAWDKNAKSETVSGSMYPHWDLYATKILRRAGRTREIMLWFQGLQQVLGRLGYAPEFLMLDGLSEADRTSWLNHGAASNLNCATGWYQALLEALFGIERDPGGISIVPLALPLGGIALSGMHCRGTVWNVKVNNDGPALRSLRVDGEEVEGSLKVPAGYHDGREHMLEITYGRHMPSPRFLELVNAEVIETAGEGMSVHARIRALGSTDVVFEAPAPGRCSLDGVEVNNVLHLPDGTHTVHLGIAGEHVLRI